MCRGRTEIAYLLLSHFDPLKAATAEVPILPKKPRADDGLPPPGVPVPAPGGGGAAVPAGPGAPGAGNPPPQQPPPPTIAGPASAARAALSAIAGASSVALAVPSESVMTASIPRRYEVLSELMQESRDRSDVDLSPSGLHTPLCLACDRGDDRLVSLLLHWGADVNKDGRKEARPLLVAAMAGM